MKFSPSLVPGFIDVEAVYWCGLVAGAVALLCSNDYQNQSLQMMLAIILGSSGLVRICSSGLKVWDPEEVKEFLDYS